MVKLLHTKLQKLGKDFNILTTVDKNRNATYIMYLIIGELI